MKKKNLIMCFLVIVLAMGYSSFASAGSVSGVLAGTWGGWTQFQDNGPARNDGQVSEDWVEDNGFVNPGWGNQAFDAEYLFYKYNKTTKVFSFGMQTGFDIVDGRQGSYYSGDVELRFNGVVYGLDYGFNATRDNNGANVGAQGATAGIYENTTWGGALAFGLSAPFAMKTGNLLTGIDFQNVGGSGSTPILTDGAAVSYYRQVSFDLASILGSSSLQSFGAHWTMSCGNDEIHGHGVVPEPGTIALLGVGLAGLAGVGARRRLKLKAVDKS